MRCSHLWLVLSVLCYSEFSSNTYFQQTVILVRHADRDSSIPDGLTQEGQDRALAPASSLKNTWVNLVVRSNTIRTRQTTIGQC